MTDSLPRSSNAQKARRLFRRALRRSHDDAPVSGELNIVPFLDVVTNLMLFLLATSSFVLTVREVRADLPSFGPHSAGGLALSVTLTDQGAVVATSGGRIGQGCVAGAPGVVAARVGEGYDLAALGRCATALHAAFPEEEQVILSADPDVPYAALIEAMDALRSDGPTPLFPEVRLSAGVR